MSILYFTYRTVYKKSLCQLFSIPMLIIAHNNYYYTMALILIIIIFIIIRMYLLTNVITMLMATSTFSISASMSEYRNAHE